MLLVLGVPLVHVLGRSLAAADTHVPVLAADDQFEVAVPLDDDLPHALPHGNDGLARIPETIPSANILQESGVSENTYENRRSGRENISGFAKGFPLGVEGEMRGRFRPNSSGLHWWVVPTAVL